MSQLKNPRLPLPTQAGRGSSDGAPTGPGSFNGVDAASSVFGHEPQELLGLSAGPTPMSITSSVQATLATSSTAPGQQIYPTETPSDYHFPRDLDLTSPHGCPQNWVTYPVTETSNGTVADPLQRLASAEPGQLPWSGIHLNGVPPSQRSRGQVERPCANTRNTRMGQQRPTTGSHANETDEGYYTYSQPDLRSMYSDESGQLRQARPDQLSIPRTMPSAQGQAGLVNYGANPSHPTAELQLHEVRPQQNSNQPSQEPHRCSEPGCSYTCKTMSDFKKHTARHKREHVCNQPRCLRADRGFATINDLERHQKTVHGMEPVHGQSRMYKCFSPNCKQAEKEWPRLDNFKQHLVRMHKDEDTQDLIQQSNKWYDGQKKPPQPDPETQHRDHTSGCDPPVDPSASRAQFHHYLSPQWQPTASLARLQQQARPANRPRHLSFSSQPNPSARASPFSLPPFRDGHLRDGHRTGEAQNGDELVNADHTQWSSEDPFDYTDQRPHGKMTSAYTVPNPNTSVSSDVPDLSFTSYPGGLAPAQGDFAQIASNFSPEQQRNLTLSDPDLHIPSTPADPAQQTSQQRSCFVETIQALINSSAGGQKREILTFIMNAGIEKLRELQRPSAAATATTNTTSSAPPSIITSSADSSAARPVYRCDAAPCTKAFPRPCDLKKHLKRHHRPYGCTFSKCFEKFGSKYDWKRHETSRHFQPECWRCPLCPCATPTPGRSFSSSAARLFYKRFPYEHHLRNAHCLSLGTAQEYVSKQRIGRNCRSRFWCGFCETIVVLHEKGLKGANERFNHIDDHFKRRRHIDTWVDIDGSVAKRQQGVEREDEDEDSEENVEDVLGGDGIGGGEVGREDESDEEGTDEDNASGMGVSPSVGTVHAGQKRAFDPEPDLASSDANVRPVHRRRTDDPDPADGSQTQVRAAYVICDQCGDGPWMLTHSKKCVSCQHICCSSCIYLDSKMNEVAGAR